MNPQVELRRRRLSETIAWCGWQRLQSNPPEGDDIKARRALGERAVNHAYAAYQLEASSVFKWVTRSKVKQMREQARQMQQQARLDTIAPLMNQLRTTALRPPAGFEPQQTDQDRSGLIEAVCLARSRQLQAKGLTPDGAALNLDGGKILRYAARQHVSSGEAKYDSKGFYDADSAPPWDTWVSYYERQVICYVPKILCGLAQRGIEVDPVECIGWADSSLVARMFDDLVS